MTGKMEDHFGEIKIVTELYGHEIEAQEKPGSHLAPIQIAIRAERGVENGMYVAAHLSRTEARFLCERLLAYLNVGVPQ